MSCINFMEELLDGGQVEWKALEGVAEYSQTRIDADELDATSFVGVDNLVADKAGRVDASYLPNTTRLTAYEPGDILLGNIRPYLKKVWRATNSGGCSGDVLAVRILNKSRPAINSKFLYYILSSDDFFSHNIQHAQGAKMPRGNKTAILNYQIPIPCPENLEKSLEIQAKIVSILDAFTTHITELVTELTTRKKQYNHYRNQLLSFEEGDAKWKTLGELCSIGVGQAPAVNERGEYPFVNAGTTPSGYVPAYNTEPDTITTPSRGQGGIGYVGYQKTRFWCGPLCYRIRSTSELLSTRFLYHVMANAMTDIVGLANMAGVPALNKKDLVGFPVPIPSPAEQERIVAILDKFDTLTNSASEGLPLEIALRQKQYEYYRNLLLGFPRSEEAEV